MDTDTEALKAAVEYMANRKTHTELRPEPCPKDPAVVAAEAAAKVEHEAICARWTELVQSKSIGAELTLPPEGLTLTMVSALKSEPLTITSITLEFPLVYDREIAHSWEGDYACPNLSPTIRIYIDYLGDFEGKKERIIDHLCDVLSSSIGKPIKLEADDWVYETEDLIILECSDFGSCWNLADHILKINEQNQQVSSDDEG